MSASSQKALGEEETDAVCDPDEEQLFEFIQRLPAEAISGREQLLKAILAAVSGNKRPSLRTQVLQGLLDCWQSSSDYEDSANETADLYAGSIWRALCLETAYHAAAMEKPSIDCMLSFWQLTSEACRHVSIILDDHFEGLASNLSAIQHLTEQAMRLISLSAGALLSFIESQALLPIKEIGQLIRESFKMMSSSFFSAKPFPVQWQEHFKKPLTDVLSSFHAVSLSALKHLESMTHKSSSHWNSESPNEADQDTDMDNHTKAVSDDFSRLVALLFRSFETVGCITASRGSHYGVINLAWKTVVSILTSMARTAPVLQPHSSRSHPAEANYDSGPGEIDEVDLPSWSRDDVVHAIRMLFQHTAHALVLGAEAGRRMLEDFSHKHGKHASRLLKGELDAEVGHDSEGEDAYKVEAEKLAKALPRVFMLTKFFQNHAIRVALLYPTEACDPAAAEDMVGLLFAYAGLLHFSNEDPRPAGSSVGKSKGLKWPVPFLVAEAMAQMLGPTIFGLVQNLLTSDKVSDIAKSRLLAHIIPAAGSQELRGNSIWTVVSSVSSCFEGPELGTSKVSNCHLSSRANLIALEQQSPEMSEWQSCGWLVATIAVLEGAASYGDHVLSVVTSNLGCVVNLVAEQHSYVPLLSEIIWPFPNHKREGVSAARARRVVLFSQLTCGLKAFVSVISARTPCFTEPAVEEKAMVATSFWEQLEAFLFQNAVHPHPICAELARDTWGFLLRHSEPQLVRSHAELLLQSIRAALQTGVKNGSKSEDKHSRSNCSEGLLLGVVAGLEERLVDAAVDVLMASPSAVLSDVFLKPFVRHINASFSKMSSSCATATAQHGHSGTPAFPTSISQEFAAVLAFSLLVHHGLAAGIHRRQPAALLPVARACFGAARAASANLMANSVQVVSWEQAALLGSMLTSITAVLNERAVSPVSGTSGLPAVFPNAKDLLRLAADTAQLRVSTACFNGTNRTAAAPGARHNQSSSPFASASIIDLEHSPREHHNGAMLQPLIARAARLVAAVSRSSYAISVNDVEPILQTMLRVIQQGRATEVAPVQQSWSMARVVMEDVAVAAAVLLSQLFASPWIQQELVHKPVALELLHALLSNHHLAPAYSSLSALHGAVSACHSATGMDTRKYAFIGKVLPQPGSGTVVDDLLQPGWTPEEAEQQLNLLFQLQQQQQLQKQVQHDPGSRLHNLRVDARMLEPGTASLRGNSACTSEPPMAGEDMCIDLDNADGNNQPGARVRSCMDGELAALPQKIAEANRIFEMVAATIKCKLQSPQQLKPVVKDIKAELMRSRSLVDDMLALSNGRC